MLEGTIGVAPPWTTVPIWAQIAVLLVNLWLGYPYFMLITSGALQSISSDLYEAATVDGATSWQKFRRITLLVGRIQQRFIQREIFSSRRQREIEQKHVQCGSQQYSAPTRKQPASLN